MNGFGQKHKVEENKKAMPQFDPIFFSIYTAVIFIIFLYYFFAVMYLVFLSLFKIKKFSKNFYYQKILIANIDKELKIRKIAKKSWIKKKLIEFYEK